MGLHLRLTLVPCFWTSVEEGKSMAEVAYLQNFFLVAAV
jgi:hypothetical protein